MLAGPTATYTGLVLAVSAIARRWRYPPTPVPCRQIRPVADLACLPPLTVAAALSDPDHARTPHDTAAGALVLLIYVDHGRHLHALR